MRIGTARSRKGQLVALIDPEIFQAQVDQASATFRSAHSATITAQAQIEKAKSDLSAAIASEKNAEAILRRTWRMKRMPRRSGNEGRCCCQEQESWPSRITIRPRRITTLPRRK